MNDIYIKDIVRVCDGELFCGNSDLICDNFSKDTRTIEKGDIYIGIKGENFDGNVFFEDAFNKGASACLLDKSSFFKLNKNLEYKDKTIVLVENSVEALQKLASYKRSLYDIPVIAVTGSVGKTSTKDIIASVVGEEYNVLKTEGNYNNEIGLPLTILRLKNHNALILEMGMSNFNEISLLSNIAKPNIGVITNIGTAHIGNLGSRENILKAKLEIIDGLDKNGVLFLNNDNDMINSNINEIRKKIDIKTIGIHNSSDFMATDIVDNVFSSNFNINKLNININVGGEAFVYNSLMAYSIGKYLNIKDESIKKGIEKFKLSANRMEKIVNNKGITIINDTYNASYDSVVEAINLVSKSNYDRKIILLGDILELGAFSEEIHKNIGKYILDKSIDKIILVGNEVKYIYDVLINNDYCKDNIYTFENEKETYSFLSDFLKENDIILIKGSHGMNLINIVEKLREI